MEQSYKEKYEQALRVAKETYDKQPMYREWLEKMFPELKESEDEKIREALIRFHKSTIDVDGIKGADIISWLEKQKEPLDKGEISDGYHTFNELYYYRMLYNAAFFNLLPKEWVHKSKKHHTGEECFGGGWFIVMAELPTGQISNHYEMKDWDLFDIPEKDVADEWDGHTPQEAAERLHNYLLEKQGEQKPSDEEMKTLLRTEYEKGRADAIAEMQGEWSEEDEKMLNDAIGAVAAADYYTYDDKQEVEDWLKSIKDRIQPKQEWSEEDKKIINGLIDSLTRISLNTRTDSTSPNYTFYKEIDWLKSIRFQNHWKPSDEQMDLLQAIINEPNNAASESCQIVLKDILEQLKKLRG